MSTYRDIELQVVLKAGGDTQQQHLQVVGVNSDGSREILKEFNEIPFAQPERAYAAPKGDGSAFKVGSAFVVGLLIGGFVVYIYMKQKQKGNDVLKMFSAPFKMGHQQVATQAPQQYYQPIMMARPENDMASWIGDFDKDIFARE